MSKKEKKVAKKAELVVREPEVPAVIDTAQMVRPEYLLAQAITKKVPVETMKEILVMRRELKEEWAREEYFKALAAFQAECPQIKKNKAVSDKPEKGGKVRYKFAPLDSIVRQVKPYLEKNGLSYMTDAKVEGNQITATCIGIHRAGHTERSSFTITIDADAYMTAPQKAAAALTFATRYAFRNCFGIMTSDEDTDAAYESMEEDVYTKTLQTVSVCQSLAQLAEWKKRLEESKKYDPEQKEQLLRAIDSRTEFLTNKQNEKPGA